MPADVAQPPVSPAPPLARHEQLHLVTVDTEAMPAIAIPTKTISTPHTGFQLDCEASDGRIHFIVKREFNAPPAKLRLARLARQTRNRSLGESSRPTPLAKRRPRVIVDATPPYRGNSRYFFFLFFVVVTIRRETPRTVSHDRVNTHGSLARGHVGERGALRRRRARGLSRPRFQPIIQTVRPPNRRRTRASSGAVTFS